MRTSHACVVAICVGVLATSACSSGDQGSSPAGSSRETASPKTQKYGEPPELRAVIPLDQPIDVVEVPRALSGTASSAKVEEAAGGASDAVSAENFALLMSQAVMDVRNPVDMPDLLDRIECDSLPSTDRDALIAEVEQQAAAGFGRQWNTSETMWIRSQGDAKTHSVELAGVIAIANGSYTGWNKYRIDIFRTADGWCVNGVSAQPFLPSDPSVPREQADIRDALEGPGWRAVKQ